MSLCSLEIALRKTSAVIIVIVMRSSKQMSQNLVQMGHSLKKSQILLLKMLFHRQMMKRKMMRMTDLPEELSRRACSRRSKRTSKRSPL